MFAETAVISSIAGAGIKIIEKWLDSKSARKAAALDYKIEALQSKNRALERVHEMKMAKLNQANALQTADMNARLQLDQGSTDALVASINAEAKTTGLDALRASVRPLVTFALVGYTIVTGSVNKEVVAELTEMVVGFWFGQRTVGR